MLTIPDQLNIATHFIDSNVALGRGQKIAIECSEQRVTYTQLLERTNRVGNALHQLGVRPEERVCLVLQDVPEFLYSFFGAIKIGAVPVPINPRLRPPEYEYILNDTRARVLIASQELVGNVQQANGSQQRLTRIVVGAQQDGYLGLYDLLEQSSPELAAYPTCKDDAAFWLYSSGSTGPPKGCVHLQHDMLFPTQYYAKDILHISETDRCYSVAKLFFAYGLGNAGYFPLSAGATTILSAARATPEGVYSDIERYRPTLFYSVPSNYAALLAHTRRGPEFDLSCIRHAISAGEPLPPALFQRFKDRFGIQILDALGSTEMLHMVISNRPGELKAGSSGKIIPGYEARIVDDSEHEVAPGEIGSLLIKCDATCAGYWNQHEKTKEMFLGHWLSTGDKYYQDEDGFFWYAGRADDLFKVNGRWLSPTEVEAALISHSSVLEAAVVPRQDGDGLLKPAAYVVLNTEHKMAPEFVLELQRWVAERLSWHKSPRWIEFLDELPKTATGKLQRFKLRERQHRSAMG
ncbi:MAG: benzoate-CoA ligase family protein [Acidobacteria bacterium]|nr:benzoate-CoA ligase family protein [Acidobacteriota bacterium]